jgi:hypothetical protein
MAITEIKRTHTAKKPDENYIPDPKIVKIAKLALILADKETDPETKRLCVAAAMRMEYITEEEGRQLIMYRTKLETFMDED